jgi:DNA-binding PadR family transcriptional regulator
MELLGLLATERSGRELSKLYQKLTGRKIQYATIYQQLGRLHRSGWVTKRFDTNDERVRLFRTSGEGEKARLRGVDYYRSVGELGREYA